MKAKIQMEFPNFPKSDGEKTQPARLVSQTEQETQESNKMSNFTVTSTLTYQNMAMGADANFQTALPTSDVSDYGFDIPEWVEPEEFEFTMDEIRAAANAISTPEKVEQRRKQIRETLKKNQETKFRNFTDILGHWCAIDEQNKLKERIKRERETTTIDDLLAAFE